jgi:Acetyl/propionyl-CoA carboxylase, alpha subunit
MIAKVIAYGRDRKEAMSRLQRALRESVIVIKDGSSNKAFLQELLSRDEVQRSEVHVGWLDHLAAAGDHLSRHHADVALVQAAIEAYDAQLAVEQAQFYASAVRGRPHVHSDVGRTAELRHRGHAYSPKVFRLGPQSYRVEIDGARIDAGIDRLGRFEDWLTVFGRRFHIVSSAQGSSYRIEVDGVSHRIDRDDGGVVHAPSPAVVISIAVKPGDSVSAGDRLAVLEAMKMEMPVLAPFSGTVRHVMTMRNVQVDAGAPLVQIDPRGGDRAMSSEGRVGFEVPSSSDGQQGFAPCLGCESLEALRQLMLGFDVDPKESARLLSEWKKSSARDRRETRDVEDEILSIFVDICSLFGREPEVNHRASGEEPSAEVHLFSYLRMLETKGEALPPAFVASLRRALAHYGVYTLDRSPKLEESLLWIYKSHQRVESQILTVLAVLERRLQRVEAFAPDAEQSLRHLLDRLIAMSNGTFPAISDLAREVRYRYFDRPFFERARKQVYDQVEAQLTFLSDNPDVEDRYERVQELVECPQPLVGLLSGRFAAASLAMKKLMLEAITWRYYRIRTLQNLHSFDQDGHCYATAEYDHEGKRIHVFTTHSDYSGLAQSVDALCQLIASVPADHDVVVDLYAWNSGVGSDAESTQQEVAAVLKPGRVSTFHSAHRRGDSGRRSRPRSGRNAALYLPAECDGL